MCTCRSALNSVPTFNKDQIPCLVKGRPVVVKTSRLKKVTSVAKVFLHSKHPFGCLSKTILLSFEEKISIQEVTFTLTFFD